MGDPKFQRKKYSNPIHPWEGERIEEEKELIKEYCFKNKKEIWKLSSKLRNFSKQAKRLIAEKTPQAEKEKLQLLKKVKGLGLLPETAAIEDILGLSLKDILERRLQSLVFRRGMARTMSQARQFITHRHIQVSGKKISVPNYLVPKELENTISFITTSALSDEMHPERVEKEKMPKKPAKKEDKKDTKKKPEAKKKEAKPKAKKEEKKAKEKKE